MARYFFHVRDGTTFVRDDEGVDLPDLDAVRWEAEQGARVFGDSAEGRNGTTSQIFEVTDESGAVVLIYPFHKS